MAKEQKPPETAAPTPDAAPEATGPPKSYRLQIALGFVSLILFQMIVLVIALSVLTKKIQDDPGIEVNGAPTNFDKPGTVPENIGTKEPLTEKTIGDKAFKVKVPEGEDNVTFSTSIHVQIRVKDAKAFDQRYAQCMHEIEDKINMILKASTREERMEAPLTAIKEKIKKEVNRILGPSYVLQVFCTEFSYETQ